MVGVLGWKLIVPLLSPIQVWNYVRKFARRWTGIKILALVLVIIDWEKLLGSMATTGLSITFTPIRTTQLKENLDLPTRYTHPDLCPTSTESYWWWIKPTDLHLEEISWSWPLCTYLKAAGAGHNLLFMGRVWIQRIWWHLSHICLVSQILWHTFLL